MRNKYKLTVIPDLDTNRRSSMEFNFSSDEDMEMVSDALANMLLFLQEDIKVMPDRSNVFNKQIKIGDGEWESFD